MGQQELCTVLYVPKILSVSTHPCQTHKHLQAQSRKIQSERFQPMQIYLHSHSHLMN